MDTPYKIYSTLELVKEVLDPTEPIFTDTETCGFYQKIRLFQAYQPHLNHVILVEWPDPIQLAVFLNGYNSVWQNAHYDITTIQQQSNTRWIPEHFEDTLYLARLHYYLQEKFALDETFIYTLGYCPYTRQKLDKKVLQKANWGVKVLSTDQLLYAATDVCYLPQLWEAVKGYLDDFNYKLDMLTVRYCLDFQWNGMPVSKDKLYERYEANVERLEELNLPINVNSYQQVRKFLDCTESDALALTTMKLKGDVKAGEILEARKIIKQNSFLDKFDTIDGRIFGKFLPSARSGRLTSKDQNLQQLPRKLKGAFEAEEGKALWYADYPQVELRSISAITKCLTMIKLFREGKDVHGFTAEGLFGKAWTKAQRQLTKTYNFNLLYGGGINMIIGILIKEAEILMTEKQATKDRRKWRSLWKEIFDWQEKGIAQWKKGRHGSTPMGRRYKAKMMTDQLNIENQGCAADIFKLALHYMYPKLKEYNEIHHIGLKICNVIHDSFIIEGDNKEEHYEPVSVIIAEAMQESWFEISKALPVKDIPMPIDIKVGTNWGDIEDDDIPNLYDYQLEGMALCKTMS